VKLFITMIVFPNFIILLVAFNLLNAGAESRTALVIGNNSYSSGPLKNPVNDANDMATTLRKLGFKVTLKTNAKLETMESAIEDFGSQLKRGGVGLFYYAGHGVQVNGINYLIPIDAKINKESDVRFKAVDAGRILAEMDNANNGFNIVLLDACRDNPFAKSFRSASRGLAIVNNSPAGTFISYSTSPGNIASDGEGRNSPYTAALLKYIVEPGLPITEVFMKVRQKVRKESGQTPWELSSLEGNFYFNRGKNVNRVEKEIELESDSDLNENADTDLENEQIKIALEQKKLRQEENLFEQRKVLAEEKRKLEEERSHAVMAITLAAAGNDIRRDGRFVAYDNGTVLDTRTNLMWSSKDNGKDISWLDAKRYCEIYRAGGYSDWRLPSQDELAGLYGGNRPRSGACINATWMYDDITVVTELIDITCFSVWASETRVLEAACFNFGSSERLWYEKSGSKFTRVLPVRNTK